MTWLALLRVLLSLAATLADYVRDKQLLDAGAAAAIGERARLSLQEIAAAQAAAAKVRDDAGQKDADPFRRHD